MNTSSNRRSVSIVLAMAAGASLVTVIGSTGSVSASEPRAGLYPKVSTATPRSFNEPLAALGGRTLGQYLSDYQARVVFAGI